MVEKAYLMFLVLRIGCFGCDFVSCCALKNGNLRGKPNKRKKRKTKIGLVSLPPSIPIFRKQRDHTNSRAERTPPTLANFQNRPYPATYTKVRNFGNFSRLLEKKRRRRSKIGFYFLTYECCWRQLSLIKMIHGVEKVLMLLCTAFGYEYLFWKYRHTRLNSEVIYSG